MLDRRWQDGSLTIIRSILSILLLHCICCNGLANQILYTEGADCSRTVQLGAATVYSHYNPATVNHFSHSQECKITFVAEREDWKLRLKFDYFDIPDMLLNDVCTDALYLFDSSKTGSRAIIAAGGNNGLCGANAPPMITSTGPYITIYFRTDISGPLGRGFKIQISAFRQVLDRGDAGCSSNNFYCVATHTCIESDLVCDGISHCTRGEDEEDAGASNCKPLADATTESSIWQTIMSLGVAGFIGVIVGSLVVLILLIVCIVCTCRRCGKKPGDTEHRQSIPTSTHGTVGVGQPQQQMVKDGVAYHQVPQMAPPPMNSHMMQNALNQYTQSGAAQQGYCPMNSFNQQQQMSALPQLQRPGYISQQSAMEMQLQAQQQQHMAACGGGPAAPSQPLPTTSYVNNYNSPFHLSRAPESHSYSSGYSSQQGPAAAANGFHPMHTKPIISQRGYTPTSGSSRSSRSRSESSVTYSKGDNHQKRFDDGRPRAIL